MIRPILITLTLAVSALAIPPGKGRAAAVPAPDLSGVAAGIAPADHLNGAVIGDRLVITARHLGAVKGQKLRVGGEAFTIVQVRPLDFSHLFGTEADVPPRSYYAAGDVALLWVDRPFPASVTRYPISAAISGSVACLHEDGRVATRGFGRRPIPGRRRLPAWILGDGSGYIAGDSGRPQLIWNKAFRRWELSGVLSRIWHGEWLRLGDPRVLPTLRAAILNPNPPTP